MKPVSIILNMPVKKNSQKKLELHFRLRYNFKPGFKKWLKQTGFL